MLDYDYDYHRYHPGRCRDAAVLRLYNDDNDDNGPYNPPTNIGYDVIIVNNPFIRKAATPWPSNMHSSGGV